MTSRAHFRGYALWIAVIDLVGLIAGGAIAVMVRVGHNEMSDYVYDHLDGWLVLFGSVILANYLAGSYRIQYSSSRFNIVVTAIFSTVFAVVVLGVTFYAWLFKILIGRGVLLLSIAWYTVISLLLKMIAYHVLFPREIFLCRTIILGGGDRAQELRRMVENAYILPVHKVIAFVNLIEGGKAPEASRPGITDGIAVMDCTAEMFDGIVKSLGADLIISALDWRQEKIYSRLRHLRFEGIEVLDLLGAVETYQGRMPLDCINEEAVTRIAMESGLPIVAGFKRVYDVAVVLTAGMVFLPVALIVALLIKMNDPAHSVLYSQMRVGQFGKLFRIYKFRTMREGAEQDTGPVWSGSDDPRITGIGAFLRRFRLDELPQFCNILKGEMSIVGPRPERPQLHVELEKKIPFYGERSNAMPGLTGWAQVRYPYGKTVEDAGRKLEYDLYYIKYLSVSLDLQIILRTIHIVLFGVEKNA